MADQRDLLKHIEILGTVVRSAILKRALTSQNSEPGLNFWRLIYGNLLDVAVLAWCMIFGSDAEPTHWKRVVPELQHEVFRADLLSAMKIDEPVWAEYREEMKTYRDTQVAHYQEGATHYPRLDLALESSYFYYTYLLTELRRMGETRFPDSLREYANRFASQSAEIARVALDSTTGIQEGVF